MAGLVVVDTDLVIDFLRGKGPGTKLVRELIQSRRLRLTAVSAFELRMGTDFHNRQHDILGILKLRTLPLDPPSALLAGEVAAKLRSLGTGIGLADCLQAGICLRFGVSLATRNRRHFDRVSGLDLIELDTDG